MNRLTTEQHAFFKQISALAFVNPFSLQREQADCVALDLVPGRLNLTQRNQCIQEKLEFFFNQLKPSFNINNFSSAIREPIQFSWLFYQFHAYQDQFYQYIDDQLEGGDQPGELPFAEALIGCFMQAGFSKLETAKFIALLYQFHRGFYFIHSAISGECPAIIKLRMHLWNNIFTFDPHWYLDYLCGKMEDFSTLLLGETGSGKSLIAHAIGCSGFIPFDLTTKKFKESFTRSFQSINLSQFPASLLESELFGHKKGAFTGAIEHHQGVFARCSAHGAVFIDEIGDIDIPTQVKLLNVIQDRTFSPVGSHDKIRFSGRVISATNRNIEQLRNTGQFRDDLYYRLCSDVINVPSLHQRLQENPEELGILIKGLLERVIENPEHKLVTRIEMQIRDSVPAYYTWPGNVRELEQCIRRICLTGRYKVINGQQMHQDFFSLPDNGSEISSQQLLQRYCRFLYHRHGSYEAVARIIQLDRRTVKKHIISQQDSK